MALEASGYAQAPANPMAGQSTPIYGGGGSMGGGGYASGGGGPVQGQHGTHYPLGSYGQSMVVTANLEHGEPIIMDPKTGQPLPPGVVPNLRDPNQYYPYQPWEASQEAQMIADAKSKQTLNQAIQNIYGPYDEARAEQITKGQAARDEAILRGSEQFKAESEKFLNNPEGYISGKAQEFGNSLKGGGGSKVGGGGGKSSTANSNIGKTGNSANDTGYAFGQGLKGAGESIGKAAGSAWNTGQDFFRGAWQGLGVIPDDPNRVGPTGQTNEQFSRYGEAVIDGHFNRQNRQQQVTDARILKGLGLEPDLGFLNRNQEDVSFEQRSKGLGGGLNANLKPFTPRISSESSRVLDPRINRQQSIMR
ncbi:hypothetical protein NG798_00640 [Ancylothrix sp. C2]|uniref:hypothetical protein n=1 Tax=Ancylothrix sp. D3o TaxID=2953691 RepID=UPI0021BBAF9A|nr:hypothetical protein [Ancylothrix sp. D3o]MCT7948300.1 hypothetical protein [Ancylothrix sp. D3o]